jgi:hypothetical protein
MRRPPSTVLFALALFAALGFALPSCTGEPPTIYCVFENEALQGGQCLTECQSRCNLEKIAGCGSMTCVADCERAAKRLSNACLDASYSYWRCLRTSGQPHVTCDGEVAVFSVPGDICRTELETKDARCPALDGGATSDAAP